MQKTLKLMSNRRSAYYPVISYTFALVIIWLASWLASVVQMFTFANSTVHSIVSAEGVRWALLSMHGSLNGVPWGSALLLLFAAGLLTGSGIIHSLSRLMTGKKISGNEVRSLLFSALVLFLYIAIVFMFTVTPWRAMLGVTGEVALSPLAQGWMLVLFVGVLVVSLVFGFMYGNYRTLADVVGSAGGYMTIFLPALMAMLPAAGIVPCLVYSGFATLIGLDEGYADALGMLLCMLPFLYVAVIRMFEKR